MLVTVLLFHFFYLSTFIYHYAEILVCKDLRFRNDKRKCGTGWLVPTPVIKFTSTSILVECKSFKSKLSQYCLSWSEIIFSQTCWTKGILFYKCVRLMEIAITIINANWTLVSLWTSLRGCTLLYFPRLKAYLLLGFRFRKLVLSYPVVCSIVFPCDFTRFKNPMTPFPLS